MNVVKMRKRIPWLGIGMSCLILVSIARGDEEAVPLEKVPKVVMQSVKTRFNDAKLSGAAKEVENGKLLYEVTIQQEGQVIDVTLTPQGEILLIEKEITSKDLPRIVSQVLEDKYPKATHKIVEEIITVEKNQEKLAYYEVLLMAADNNVWEAQITADGTIINVEKKSPDEGSDK